MTVTVDDRVREARRRLRLASDERTRTDPAVRILTLASPRHSDPPLRLHSGLTVLNGLSEDGRAALAATVAALYEGGSTAGLEGFLLLDGRQQPLSAPRPPAPSQLAGPQAIFGNVDHPPAAPLPIGWAEVSDLNELAASIESAVRLTEAELRGADEAARQLRIEQTDVPQVIDLRAHDGDRTEIRETLAAIESMSPEPAIIERLRQARGGPNPGDALRPVLAELGLDPSTDPEAVAAQVLREAGELESIRRRLEGQLVGVAPAATPGSDPNAAELHLLDVRRTRLRRRLRSQRGFLAAAQDHLSFATEAVDALPSRFEASAIPPNSGGRPLPLLIEDPLHDIPGQQGISALGVLLRVSELCQVICVSDDPELQDWAAAMGDRAAWVRAAGWFAGEATC